MSIIWPSCFQRLSTGQITFHVRSQKQGNAGKYLEFLRYQYLHISNKDNVQTSFNHYTNSVLHSALCQLLKRQSVVVSVHSLIHRR